MTNDRPISIVSFTHFGYFKDLKSYPTYYTTRSLAQSDLLRELIVLDVADTYDIRNELFSVPVPGGKLLPRVFYLTEHLTGLLDGRKWTLDLFDRFAAKRVGNERVLHSFPQMVRTLQAAKHERTILAVYASASHPESAADLYSEEARKLDLDEPYTLNQRYVEGIEVADYLLCLSEYSKSTYVERGMSEDRTFTVGPLSADLDLYPPTSPPDNEFVVVTIANMTVLKGIHYLLDAWQQLDLPKARLVLCGTMNDTVRPLLETRIEAMNDVEHVGYVDDPQPYYEQASVVVHPSLSESFGKVIAEAMASAVPVVVTENCPTEYVDDAGLVAPIRDADVIAEHIRYLYDNPVEAREMGKRGREIVESNTWDDFSKRVKAAHETILEREGYDI